jgi:hypothetical protein
MIGYFVALVVGFIVGIFMTLGQHGQVLVNERDKQLFIEYRGKIYILHEDK